VLPARYFGFAQRPCLWNPNGMQYVLDLYAASGYGSRGRRGTVGARQITQTAKTFRGRYLAAGPRISRALFFDGGVRLNEFARTKHAILSVFFFDSLGREAKK
jgi:hypothetical protein